LNPSVKKIFPVLLPVAAVMISFAIGGLLMLIIGKNPVEIYAQMFSQTLGSSYGIGQVLFRTTPLIFTGLAVAVPFQAGLFNIGAEGQLQVGTFFTAIVGMLLPEWMPAVLSIPICILTAMITGGLWAGIAGGLRTKFGTSEVINTIMLNFIAFALVGYLLANGLAVKATMRTQRTATSADIPRFDVWLDIFKNSPVNLSLLLAVLLAVAVYFFLFKTRFGYELRAVGLSVPAAEYAGISANVYTLVSMMTGGALAGLVSTNFVLGYKHYYESGFSSGLGFIGIAVALLANSNPLGILASAFLFGLLDYGGLVINSQVPKEIFLILQAVVIIFVISFGKRFSK
jgi:ABC-type uncharacterized transport system permease subunit